MHNPTFKQFQYFITGMLFMLGTLLSGPASAGPEVQVADNLAQVTDEAAERGVPLLLVFSSPECSYCTLLEEDFLQPMLISGMYEDKVIIRKLNIDAGSMVVDFQGRNRLARAIADDYDIDMTPTVVLLGPEGRELTQRLIGVTTPDFYGGYLDRAIDAANAALDKVD